MYYNKLLKVKKTLLLNRGIFILLFIKGGEKELLIDIDVSEIVKEVDQ